MGVKFKVHETPDSNTRDVVVRISTIENGFVVKAGGKPYYCTSEKDLKEKIDDLVSRFVSNKP